MSDIDHVRALGDRIGYGHMMKLAQQCWREKLEPMGIAGGEFSTGPCVGMLVPCVCAVGERGRCDWCCGTGTLTKRVREAMSLPPRQPLPRLHEPADEREHAQERDHAQRGEGEL